MFAIEIIVAMEEIKVIKVCHDCFPSQGGFLLSLSGRWVHTFCLVSIHFLLTQPFLPSSGEPLELFWASVPLASPWLPFLPFPRSSSVFVSEHLRELRLFTTVSPSRGIDERAGHLL